MSWLEDLQGVTVLDAEGTAMPKRAVLKLTGAVAVSDDVPNSATKAEFASGPIGKTVTDIITAVGTYSKQPVTATGYAADGDGGGGEFYWHPSSTATPDGGTVFQVGSSPGRWIRHYEGVANVRWWGATGDGATNDTTAIQNALNAASAVYIPPGTYMVNRILVPSNRELFGAGALSVLKLRSGQNSALLVNSTWGTGNTNIHIHDLKLDGNKANNTQSSGNRTHCIALMYATKSSVRRCWIVDAALDGILIGANQIPYSGTTIGGGSQYIDVTDCLIENVDRNGVSVTSGTDVTIARNTFVGCNAGCVAPLSNPGVYGAGSIDLEPNDPVNDSCKRIVIAHNRLHDCKYTGIQFSGSPILENVQVIGNNVHLSTGVNRPAIDISTTVTGCVVAENVTSGACTRGVTWSSLSDGGGANKGVISGNVFGTSYNAALTAGVQIQHGAKDVVVLGNYMSGFQLGISVNGSLFAVSDVVAMGNVIETTSSANYITATATVTGLVDVGNIKGSGELSYSGLSDVAGSHPTRLSIGQTAGTSAITKHCTGSKTWDPASVADGAVTSTTVTVTGAVVGNTVTVGFSQAVPAGALLVGAVTAADTVTVTLLNHTGAPLDLASGTLRADTWAH